MRPLRTSQIAVIIRILCLLAFLIMVRSEVEARRKGDILDLHSSYLEQVERQANERARDLDIDYKKLKRSYFLYLIRGGDDFPQ